MAETVVVCTYCVSPVPAAKTCLLCEVSLCDDHLRAHSKSVEHILHEPASTLANRRCPIHNKNLKYCCSDDAAYICVTCCLDGDHREHHVEPLFEAAKKLKENLTNILGKLIKKKEEAENEIRSLHLQKTRIQDNHVCVTEQVTVLFQDLRKQLTFLENQVLNDISKQVQQISDVVSEHIQQLEKMKDELYSKTCHIEELCNMTDPLTVLQGGKTYSADLCDTNVESNDTEQRHGEMFQCVGDLDKGLISVTLHKGLSDILIGAKEKLNVQKPSDILFDVKTAGKFLDVLGDLKIAKSSEKKVNRPKISERFQYSQVLSTSSFSLGQHYWEVETCESGNWRVGICYPSMDRKGEKSYIGDNNKSWCLGWCDGVCSVMHNKKVTDLFRKSASCKTVGIYLDYEAGQLSFYALCNPIRHLHTFTATFTEPVHAAFGVWNSYLRINN
ncbi:E3 ubiquitin-protein ligase TRIM39-like [Pseudophryne corroboree]|uniref:E3 ubiquitin-protein ligase TRIM39-like n=1 Tax=Pseudophryne corroboree TaxID=495146 RepID=UPI0030818DE5